MTNTNANMASKVEIPKRMFLTEDADSLEFRYSWFRIKYLISLAAAPIFAYFIINSSFVVGDYNQPTSSVFMVLLVSMVVFYFSLAKLINETKIVVTQQIIEVKNSPLPFSVNLKLRNEDVTQLYVTQHRVGHRYYLFAATYQLNAILKSKNVVTLVKKLQSPEQGRFIENKIEKFLNIADTQIEGELSKD